MSEYMIEQQQQPCSISCFTTCMAMLLGVPATSLLDTMHTEYLKNEKSLGEFLSEYGIEYTEYMSAQRNSVKGSGVFILAVPSLNIEGVMHYVLLEMLDDGWWNIFDPNNGKDGKRYYVPEHTHLGDNAVAFSSGYTLEAHISHDALRSARDNMASKGVKA